MQKTIKNVVNKGFFSVAALMILWSFPFMVSAQGVVSASTGPALVGINSVTLFASVNPNGSDAFTWFEYGPGGSLTSSTNKRYISSLASDSMISFKLDSLEVGRFYSYRVVAYNAYGTAYGQVRTFTTTAPTGMQEIIPPTVPAYNSGYGVAVNSSVITKSATSVSYYTARLNATALPGSNTFAIGWFEFGETQALGVNTRTQNLGSYGSMDYSEDITGLTPNTIYYYRAIMQGQNGIQYGSTLTFRTQTFYGDTIAPIKYKPVYKSAPESVSNVGYTTQSSPIVVITPANSTVSPGEIYRYTLRVHNDSSASMRNADITVMLPAKLTYQAQGGSGFVENGGVLISRGNEVAPFSDKDFSFSVRVSDNAQNNDLLPVTAIVRFTRDGSIAEDATGYALASVTGVANPAPVASTTSGASASATSGASSLPAEIIPWLIAAILLIAIVLVGVSLYGQHQKRR